MFPRSQDKTVRCTTPNSLFPFWPITLQWCAHSACPGRLWYLPRAEKGSGLSRHAIRKGWQLPMIPTVPPARRIVAIALQGRRRVPRSQRNSPRDYVRQACHLQTDPGAKNSGISSLMEWTQSTGIANTLDYRSSPFFSFFSFDILTSISQIVSRINHITITIFLMIHSLASKQTVNLKYKISIWELLCKFCR